MKSLSHAQHVLVNRLATPLGAFAVLIAIGRHSDALLGQYALVMSFYFIMQMLPLLGLTSYVMREVAREPARAGHYLSTIGVLSMVGCGLVDLGVWALLPYANYPSEVRQAIAMIGLLIFPGILLFLVEILFMSVHRARPIAVVAVWENVARVLLSLTLLAMGQGLLGLMGVFLLTRLAALVAYLVMLRRMGIVSRWEPLDFALLRRTVVLLPSFFAGTLLLAVFSRLDFFVLSLFQPLEQIGYYAIGYRPYEITIMMMTALLMAIFPRVSRVFARTPRQYARWSRDAILGFAGVLSVASVFGVLLAHDYVFLLFSRQYPAPVPLTQLFMAVVVLAGLDFVVGALLHAADRQHADTRAMLFGGLVQLGLLLLLVPPYGLYGALLAKVTATLVQAAIKFLFLRRAFGPILGAGAAWRLAVVALLLAFGCWLVLDASWPLRWLAAGMLSFVVLPAACLALGLVRPLRLLRSQWRRRHAQDAAIFPDLLDLVAADSRAHTRRTRGRRSRMDRELAATLCHRVARYLHLAGRTRLAAAVGALREMLIRPVP